jgi:hypothetical protein
MTDSKLSSARSTARANLTTDLRCAQDPTPLVTSKSAHLSSETSDRHGSESSGVVDTMVRGGSAVHLFIPTGKVVAGSPMAWWISSAV